MTATEQETGPVAAPRRVSPRQAALLLAERDPVLARLVTEAGLPRFPKPNESHFAALVRSIVYQQLAGAAAQAIHGRLIGALGGAVTPDRILATPPAELRAAGLSGNKLLSLQDLAAKVLDGMVLLNPRHQAAGRAGRALPPVPEHRGLVLLARGAALRGKQGDRAHRPAFCHLRHAGQRDKVSRQASVLDIWLTARDGWSRAGDG
jgi:hypothetical protein